jgi:hypothetical protein
MDNNTKASNRAHDIDLFSAEALAQMGVRDTVYIRGVLAGRLMAEGLLPKDVPLAEDQMVYAVHAADGTPLAVVDSRDMAFASARQYNKKPVSVH